MNDEEYWSYLLPEDERWLSRPRAGVRFVKVVEPDEIVERPETITAAITAYRELIALHGAENVFGITAFKDKPAGVLELNNAIRLEQRFDTPVPHPGELLMVVKNASDALNGERYQVERYQVTDVSKNKGWMEARLLGTKRRIVRELAPHKRGPCKNVDWGYFGTVHKFQGSEAAAVVCSIPSGTLKLMTATGGEQEPWFCDRSFVYTACSRPKLSLVLVGDPSDICKAIALNRSDRITALSRMFAADPRLFGGAVGARPQEQRVAA